MEALICDSCENPIEERETRVQVLIFTKRPVADPRLDLCHDCAKELKKLAKVVRAQEKALARVEAFDDGNTPRPPVEEGVTPAEEMPTVKPLDEEE